MDNILSSIFQTFSGPYMICAALGAFLGTFLVYLNFSRRQLPEAAKLKLSVGYIVVILLGACFSNIGNWVFMDLWRLPLAERIARAGLAWYPGILAAIGAYALLAKAIREREWPASAIPAVPLFHAFGRVGCCISGCCYGAEARFEVFGIVFRRVPTAQMEAGFELLLFIALQFFVKRRHVCVYLLAYSAFRFILEFFRGDMRGAFIPFIPLSPAQQIAILVVAGVLVHFFIARGRVAIPGKGNELKEATLS